MAGEKIQVAIKPSQYKVIVIGKATIKVSPPFLVERKG